MKLAVTILNFRTPDMTVDATQSTVAALINAPFEWCITIVDNDSGDGSEDKLRAALAKEQERQTAGWDRIEVLQSGHNGGFGAGNNVGINHAMSQYSDLEYAYILNSDAFPEPDALVALVDFMDSHQDYGIAGSYIQGTDGEAHQTAFRFPSIPSEFEAAIKLGPVSKLLKKYIVPMDLPGRSIDLDWTAGASLLFRVKMIKDIGLFDETFFLYFEETDLCLRAKRAGWKIRYVLESKVVHIGSVSTGMKKWDRIPSYWLDSRRHYFVKNHGRFYFWLATLAKLLGRCFWKLRCALTHKEDGEPKQFGRDIIKHALS